ncbi:TIGR04540 family protein [Clostridium ihumii]|uniref:TIGR04540 family protein n=1 Tax=Clostridium ihumii TaxID=1470356 RepID=UPI00055317ED|nr:TIGR04540 family protein [Clostridium ihumii]
MRKVYKNPKELATCVKDLVDVYLDELISYEDLEKKVIILLESNDTRFYKDGKMSSKIFNVIGSEYAEIVDKIVKNQA